MNRLFALRNTDDAIKVAEQERFHRITADYVLIYTDKESISKSIEITNEHADKLSANDLQWLSDCLTVVLTENNVQTKAADIMAEKIKKLEEALEAEQDKINKGE